MTPKGRRALASSGAALAVAGAVVIAQAVTTLPALAAPARAQQPAGSTGWRVSASVSGRGHFTVITGVAADSGGDAWAIGVTAGHVHQNHAVIVHWTGKAWRRVQLPDKLLKGIDQGSDFLASIGAASVRDVWIFSGKGQYLRLVGGRWTRGRLPVQKTGGLFPQSVKVFGPDDVWVFGCRARSLNAASSNCHPFAARFNGRSWQVFRLPGEGVLGEVSAPSTKDIWTITGPGEDGLATNSRSRIVHWNGTAWRAMPVQPKVPAKVQLSAITATSGSDIWVGGTAPNAKHGSYELIRHWNGKAWTDASPAAKPTRNQPLMEDLVPDGAGGIWELALSGNYEDTSRIRHFSHGRWLAPANVDWVLIKLAPIPGTSSTWGVGTSKNVSRGLIVLHGPRPH